MELRAVMLAAVLCMLPLLAQAEKVGGLEGSDDPANTADALGFPLWMVVTLMIVYILLVIAAVIACIPQIQFKMGKDFYLHKRLVVYFLLILAFLLITIGYTVRPLILPQLLEKTNCIIQDSAMSRFRSDFWDGNLFRAEFRVKYLPVDADPLDPTVELLDAFAYRCITKCYDFDDQTGYLDDREIGTIQPCYVDGSGTFSDDTELFMERPGNIYFIFGFTIGLLIAVLGTLWLLAKCFGERSRQKKLQKEADQQKEMEERQEQMRVAAQQQLQQQQSQQSLAKAKRQSSSSGMTNKSSPTVMETDSPVQYVNPVHQQQEMLRQQQMQQQQSDPMLLAGIDINNMPLLDIDMSLPQPMGNNSTMGGMGMTMDPSNMAVTQISSAGGTSYASSGMPPQDVSYNMAASRNSGQFASPQIGLGQVPAMAQPGQYDQELNQSTIGGMGMTMDPSALGGNAFAPPPQQAGLGGEQNMDTLDRMMAGLNDQVDQM